MALIQVTMLAANPEIQVLGGVVYITAVTWNASGALASAGTSTTIQITGPNAAIIQSFTAMTADSTGKFSYKFVTATSNLPGAYSVEIRATDSAEVYSKLEPYLFTLYDPPR